MARSRVIVEYPNQPAYAVRIGSGLLEAAGADLRALAGDAARCLVLCDADARQRCLPALKASLQNAGFKVQDIAVPSLDPEDAWACVGELQQAFSQLDLPQGTPIVACGCVQAAELMAFAVALCDAGFRLVLVPASLAAACRLSVATAFELDAGYRFPLKAGAGISHVLVDIAALNCESGEEAQLGRDELALAVQACDDQFRSWYAGNAEAVAAGEEDALVLALAQALASRADAIGAALRA